MRRASVFTAIVLLAGRPATAQRIGSVHFPTSCRAAAQPDFDRAVALLHFFAFGPASDGFQAVLRADPRCAMAWWGIALEAFEATLGKEPNRFRALLELRRRADRPHPRVKLSRTDGHRSQDPNA